MSTFTLTIGAAIMLLLIVVLLVALLWLHLLLQEAQSDIISCQNERDQLRLLCRQQEAELAELCAGIRAEKAHVQQLQRQISLGFLT